MCLAGKAKWGDVVFLKVGSMKLEVGVWFGIWLRAKRVLVSGIMTEHLMVCELGCLYSRLLIGEDKCEHGGLTGLL